MASKTKRVLIRLLRLFIQQGHEPVVRKRLRGVMYHRSRCMAKAQEYLNMLRLAGDARQWTGRSVQDSLTHELRQTASSLRVDCQARLKAIEHLMMLAGYTVTVEPDATTKLIQSLVAPAPETKPVESKPLVSGALPADVFDFSHIGRS